MPLQLKWPLTRVFPFFTPLHPSLCSRINLNYQPPCDIFPISLLFSTYRPLTYMYFISDVPLLCCSPVCYLVNKMTLRKPAAHTPPSPANSPSALWSNSGPRGHNGLFYTPALSLDQKGAEGLRAAKEWVFDVPNVKTLRWDYPTLVYIFKYEKYGEKDFTISQSFEEARWEEYFRDKGIVFQMSRKKQTRKCAQWQWREGVGGGSSSGRCASWYTPGAWDGWGQALFLTCCLKSHECFICSSYPAVPLTYLSGLPRKPLAFEKGISIILTLFALPTKFSINSWWTVLRLMQKCQERLELSSISACIDKFSE